MRCLRLIVDESSKITGYPEMVIPAKIEGHRENFPWGTVGPPNLMKGRNGVMIGPTLVDVQKEYLQPGLRQTKV